MAFKYTLSLFTMNHSTNRSTRAPIFDQNPGYADVGHRSSVARLLLAIALLAPAIALLSLLIPNTSNAQTTIVVSDPKSRAPIAVPQLCARGGMAESHRQIPEVVSKDLDLSGYFEVISPNSFIEAPGKCLDPDIREYGDWTMIRT